MALTLLFTLGDETYGLEIDAIQEIVEDQVLHYVPRARGVLTGAVNFHGRILPVIDLPLLLGFADRQRSSRRLVLSTAHHALVLTVNGVERIVELDIPSLQPPSAAAEGRAVRGLVEYDGQTVKLLDTVAICAQLDYLHPDRRTL